MRSDTRFGKIPLLRRALARFSLLWIVLQGLSVSLAGSSGDSMQSVLEWGELPSFPDPVGVAGPFVGISHDVLIVAGGANFPEPVWQREKVWRDRIYVLEKSRKGQPIHPLTGPTGFKESRYRWVESGRLLRPRAYGAAVTHGERLICLGGLDGPKRLFGSIYFDMGSGETGNYSPGMAFPAQPLCLRSGSGSCQQDLRGRWSKHSESGFSYAELVGARPVG